MLMFRKYFLFPTWMVETSVGQVPKDPNLTIYVCKDLRFLKEIFNYLLLIRSVIVFSGRDWRNAGMSIKSHIYLSN